MNIVPINQLRGPDLPWHGIQPFYLPPNGPVGLVNDEVQPLMAWFGWRFLVNYLEVKPASIAGK